MKIIPKEENKVPKIYPVQIFKTKNLKIKD